MHKGISWMSVLLLLFPAVTFAQTHARSDASLHSVQYVEVEKGVKVEVLDWGGHGSPLVFLAGFGDTGRHSRLVLSVVTASDFALYFI
jgi:hypothetical protein